MSDSAHRVVRVDNKQGIHARPSALIVKTANRFKSDITIANPAIAATADAKRVMDVMTLVATQGTMLTIMAHGEDAAAAVDAIVTVIETGFGED